MDNLRFAYYKWGVNEGQKLVFYMENWGCLNYAVD